MGSTSSFTYDITSSTTGFASATVYLTVEAELNFPPEFDDNDAGYDFPPVNKNTAATPSNPLLRAC